MDYIPSFERIAIQKGIQQGIELVIEQGIKKGGRIILLHQLHYKFKTIPISYSQKIEQENSETLLKWAERILECQNLEDVFEV